MASCGYSQTVLYLLLLFRQGCSAAPRGAEGGRRGHDQKNILWRWKDVLPQLTFRPVRGCFFVLNCKKVLCLGLVYFVKSSHEEQEEQAVGQQSAFAQTYSHPVLPCAHCLTGNFEASARGACLSHTCVITGQCPTTGKIGEIPILSV